MPYGNLLKKHTREKKITYKELAKKCTELGEPLTASYIKEVVNNRKKPPSEKKSRAIEKVLGLEENILVLEGYIDKAPKEIKDLLNKIREVASITGLVEIENTINNEQYEKVKEEMYNQSMSEYFVDFLEDDEIDYTNNTHVKITREGVNFSINCDDIDLIEVKDDSMEPKIEKGDKIKIKIEDNYINGEIVAVKIKGYNEPIYRIIHFNNGLISLTPLNTKEYKTIDYNKDDIEILGKVSKVIKEL